MQIGRTLLPILVLASSSGAFGDEMTKAIERRIAEHIKSTFTLVEIDGKTHAFNGKVKGSVSSSYSYSGKVYEYGTIETKYTALPLEPADIANEILWKGDIEVYASPYRKIYYTNGVSAIGGVHTGREGPCWQDWQDMDKAMSFRWKFVLTKHGWRPNPFRVDHPNWRWSGGPPITREGVPSRELVVALLNYERCGY